MNNELVQVIFAISMVAFGFWLGLVYQNIDVKGESPDKDRGALVMIGGFFSPLALVYGLVHNSTLLFVVGLFVTGLVVIAFTKRHQKSNNPH